MKNISAAKHALLLATLTLVIGAVYISLTPVGHVPDVWEHVYRVSAIANGDVIARPVDSISDFHHSAENVGGAVDWAFVELSQEYDDGYDPGVVHSDSIVAFNDATADVPFNNTAINSPIAYAPQLIAFMMGRVLGLDAPSTYFLAEWTMLVVFALAMGVALWLLPRYRWFMFVVFLLPPLTFRYSFAISADSFTQAVAAVLACLVFRLAFPPSLRGGHSGKSGLGAGSIFALFVCALTLGLTKFTYAPLALVALTIPWIRRPLPARQVMALVVGVIAALVVALAWVKVAAAGYVTTPSIVSGADVAAKTQAAIADPLAALSSIVYSIAHFQANNVGNSYAMMAVWAVFLAVGVVLVIATVRATKLGKRMLEGDASIASARDSRRSVPLGVLVFCWTAFVLCVGIMLLVYLALYLQYTPIGIPGVLGIQFRYANPLVPFLALCLRAGWEIIGNGVLPKGCKA